MKKRVFNQPYSILPLLPPFIERAILTLLLTFLALFYLSQSTSLYAQTTFPQLTGRIVDNAHLLDQETIQNLTSILAQHEQKTGDQLVIATLPSLQGQDIESYSNALFRQWGLGQKDKNNGVLFLIAPNERAVRIEVGYGLESTLTDAATSIIIHSIILPQFRDNNYQKGIIEGTRSILQVIYGGEQALNKDVK